MSEYTTLRSEIYNWTLDSDDKLFKKMERFATNLITKIEGVDADLKNIKYAMKSSGVNINYVFSKFQNLSHQKFTENRLYAVDDNFSVRDSNSTNLLSLANEPEQNIVSRYQQALHIGMEAVNVSQYVNNGMSLDDDDKFSMSDEPAERSYSVYSSMIGTLGKNKLPYIIGTNTFYNDDYLGIMENPNKNDINNQADNLGVGMQASQNMNSSRLGNQTAGQPTSQNAVIVNPPNIEPPPNILLSLLQGNQQQVQSTINLNQNPPPFNPPQLNLNPSQPNLNPPQLNPPILNPPLLNPPKLNIGPTNPQTQPPNIQNNSGILPPPNLLNNLPAPKLNLAAPKLESASLPDAQPGRDGLLDAIRNFKKPLNKVSNDEGKKKPMAPQKKPGQALQRTQTQPIHMHSQPPQQKPVVNEPQQIAQEDPQPKQTAQIAEPEDTAGMAGMNPFLMALQLKQKELMVRRQTENYESKPSIPTGSQEIPAEMPKKPILKPASVQQQQQPMESTSTREQPKPVQFSKEEASTTRSDMRLGRAKTVIEERKDVESIKDGWRKKNSILGGKQSEALFDEANSEEDEEEPQGGLFQKRVQRKKFESLFVPPETQKPQIKIDSDEEKEKKTPKEIPVNPVSDRPSNQQLRKSHTTNISSKALFEDDSKEILKKEDIKTNRMSKLFENSDDEDDKSLMTRTKEMTLKYKREQTTPEVVQPKKVLEDKSLFPGHLTSPKASQQKKEEPKMASIFKDDSDDDFLKKKPVPRASLTKKEEVPVLKNEEPVTRKSEPPIQTKKEEPVVIKKKEDTAPAFVEQKQDFQKQAEIKPPVQNPLESKPVPVEAKKGVATFPPTKTTNLFESEVEKSTEINENENKKPVQKISNRISDLQKNLNIPMDGLRRGEGGVMLHPRRKKEEEAPEALDVDSQLERPVMIKKKKPRNRAPTDDFDIEGEAMKVEKKAVEIRKDFDIESSAQMTNDEENFGRPSKQTKAPAKSKMTFEDEDSEGLSFRPSTKNKAQAEVKPVTTQREQVNRNSIEEKKPISQALPNISEDLFGQPSNKQKPLPRLTFDDEEEDDFFKKKKDNNEKKSIKRTSESKTTPDIIPGMPNITGDPIVHDKKSDGPLGNRSSTQQKDPLAKGLPNITDLPSEPTAKNNSSKGFGLPNITDDPVPSKSSNNKGAGLPNIIDEPMFEKKNANTNFSGLPNISDDPLPSRGGTKKNSGLPNISDDTISKNPLSKPLPNLSDPLSKPLPNISDPLGKKEAKNPLAPVIKEEPKKKSMFDDDDDDFFSKPKNVNKSAMAGPSDNSSGSNNIKKPAAAQKPLKSLFDDDDDDGGSLFGGGNKKANKSYF